MLAHTLSGTALAPMRPKEERMAEDRKRDAEDDMRILGDINPTRNQTIGQPPTTRDSDQPAGEWDPKRERSMGGGSNEDRTEHSGSRDVTEGTSGGTGAEVGGSRNYRTGTGATGSDLGNRPE
jgi:hypothetical protein